MHGSAFAEVLDWALGVQEAAEPLPGAPPPGHAAPPHPFLFTAPAVGFRARVAAPIAVVVDRVRTPPPDPPRPPRAMTPAERRALDGLNALGARLSADFGPRELRSAFRALARRYHPDRHPSSTDAERARLSRAFAELTDHHRRLAALVETGAVRH